MECFNSLKLPFYMQSKNVKGVCKRFRKPYNSQLLWKQWIDIEILYLFFVFTISDSFTFIKCNFFKWCHSIFLFINDSFPKLQMLHIQQQTFLLLLYSLTSNLIFLIALNLFFINKVKKTFFLSHFLIA